MKKSLVYLCVFLFTFRVFAGTLPASERYCATLIDGVLMLTLDNQVIKSNVTLKNGAVLTTDGTVIRKDGTKTVLSQGSCVDGNGNLIKPPVKEPFNKKVKK